jgi:hypothetical protein
VGRSYEVALPTLAFGTEFWAHKARGINTIQPGELKHLEMAAGCDGLGICDSKHIWGYRVKLLLSIL